MQFLKYFLAAFLALVLFFSLSFFFFLGIATLAGQSSKPQKLDEPSLLKLNFPSQIVENGADDPFDGIDLPFSGPDQGMGLNDIKRSLKNAALDPNILGVYMDFSNFPGGLGMALEVRNAIEEFKESGKPVIFYGDFLSERGYFLASVADSVYLNPSGVIELNGANYEMVFFKNTLEKLEIKPEVFKVGKFKSAIEPFILSEMSTENRTQTEALLGSLYGDFLERVSASRNMESSTLAEISRYMKARTPQDALSYGLIDDVVYKDQAIKRLKDMVGYGEDEKISLESISAYKKYDDHIETPDTRDRIAVLVAEGEIRSGKSEEGVIGSETMIKEIIKLRDNDRVKAVVLRVNSPGGEGLASDDIWRELEILNEKKPLVASMSDMAASGGYYISMGSDYIFAEPTTITGSIGVFALLFDMTDFFGNKLGITRDAVNTGEYSDIMSPLKPMSDGERDIVQSFADRFYDTFTKKAANGRGMEQDQIKEVGEGRVWSGVQAKDLGLVDELGGLESALNKAAQLAEIDDFKVKYYPRPKNFYEQVFEEFSGASSLSTLKEEMGILYPLISKANALKAKKGLWTRLPMGWSVTF